MNQSDVIEEKKSKIYKGQIKLLHNEAVAMQEGSQDKQIYWIPQNNYKNA